MEESTPYTGNGQYVGGPGMHPPMDEPRVCSPADEGNALTGVAVMFDSRRLTEIDLFDSAARPDSDSSLYSPPSRQREARVAYCHDLRRISAHPLGPVELPTGAAKWSWRKLHSGEVPLFPEPSPAAAPSEPPLVKSAPVRMTEKTIVIPPAPRPKKGSSGSGATPPDPPVEEKRDPTEMPFLDHLEELRWVILKSIIVIVIAMIASWYLSDWFYNQITDLARGGKSFLGDTTSVNIALDPLGKHPGKVAGVITDAKTRKPLSDATVVVNPGNYTTLTDSLGQYSITGIPRGSYSIAAAKNGYSANTRNSGMKLVMTTVMEPLIIRLQMALVMGLVLAVPLVFYFIWSFVAPGLYQNEKSWVLPLVFAATGCFFVGAGLAWFIVVPYMLKFLQTFMPADVDGMFTFSKFLGIILKFTLSFGIIFEMPMVAFVLAKVGILKHRFMSKYRGYALVLVFIVSAIITPTVDPVSQTLMAIPLYLLYEVSILVARFAGKKTLM
jgi:sec-independent protein translocase protein TatC